MDFFREKRDLGSHGQYILSKGNALAGLGPISLQEEVRAVFEPFFSNPDVFFLRQEFPMSPFSILSWVSGRDAGQKVYWEARDKQTESGGFCFTDTVRHSNDFGIVFSQMRERMQGQSPLMRYYGGVKFDLEEKGSWGHQEGLLFVLPMFEIVRMGENYNFVCQILIAAGEDRAEAARLFFQNLQEALRPDTGRPERTTLFSVSARSDNPNQENWARAVEDLLREFEEGRLSKAVLSRQTKLLLNQEPPSFYFLSELKKIHKAAFFFGIQESEHSSFVGCTPERLYKREAGAMFTEALAGTAPRGATKEQDDVFGEKLLSGQKEIQEHWYVLDFIAKALNELCDGFYQDEKARLLKLPHVQHLLYEFKGVLKDGVTDEQILQALHPTPAVCGYPKDLAYESIRRLEKHKRGWYTGAVGCVGLHETQFVVGIRSALQKGRVVSLFAGAGIVKGSVPESEWEEIENKIRHYLNIFV